MSLREFTKLVFCGNGDRIKYHYYEYTDKPPIERIGNQYFFNRQLTKTEVFRADKPSQPYVSKPTNII
jgi:hypothetical protein